MNWTQSCKRKVVVSIYAMLLLKHSHNAWYNHKFRYAYHRHSRTFSRCHTLRRAS